MLCITSIIHYHVEGWVLHESYKELKSIEICVAVFANDVMLSANAVPIDFEHGLKIV